MVSTAPRTQEDIGIAEVTPQRGDEVFGASQVGPFDYVPRVGFREYWYPGVWSEKGRQEAGQPQKCSATSLYCSAAKTATL